MMARSSAPQGPDTLAQDQPRRPEFPCDARPVHTSGSGTEIPCVSRMSGSMRIAAFELRSQACQERPFAFIRICGRFVGPGQCSNGKAQAPGRTDRMPSHLCLAHYGPGLIGYQTGACIVRQAQKQTGPEYIRPGAVSLRQAVTPAALKVHNNVRWGKPDMGIETQSARGASSSPHGSAAVKARLGIGASMSTPSTCGRSPGSSTSAAPSGKALPLTLDPSTMIAGVRCPTSTRFVAFGTGSDMRSAKLRQAKLLNYIVEQDHRRIKRLVRPALVGTSGTSEPA